MYSKVRVRLARRETGLSPPVKYFTDRSKRYFFCGSFMFLFCLVFAMSLCTSVYMYFVVTCWERADLLALVCGVLLWVCHFPIGILGQVWYLIVSIPDLCTLTYFANSKFKFLRKYQNESIRIKIVHRCRCTKDIQLKEQLLKEQI